MGREALKWVAIILMTVDHVGAVLYPEDIIFRLIGRLSFPIFCYLITLGVESTRNIVNYLTRLFVFALISQAPYCLALGYEPFESLNIFFTLFSGVVFIHFHKKRSLLALIPFIASFLLRFDYGVYGISLIGCMYLLNKETRLGVVSATLLNVLFMLVSPVQILSLLAFPIILFHKCGPKLVRDISRSNSFRLLERYSKYIYYPLHLTILHLIRLAI